MAEYYDSDTLKKAFGELYTKLSVYPTADVQPVRHGKWTKDSDGLTICSEGEEVALQRVFIKLPEKIVDLQMRESRYCPNCGAKMDTTGMEDDNAKTD